MEQAIYECVCLPKPTKQHQFEYHLAD